MRLHTSLLFLHVALGVLAKAIPKFFCLYYVMLLPLACVVIFQKKDKNFTAGKFILYAMGMEIVYRISGARFLYEFGKYACIALALCGLLFSRHWQRRWPTVLLFLLLLPALALTRYPDTFFEYRKLILFNLSGPLVLVFSAMYFYLKRVEKEELFEALRWAIYPSITLLVVLFMGTDLSEVKFTADSNFSTSGGFGPNQVSSVLGYFCLVLVFAIWHKMTLTLNRLTDIVVLTALFMRCLLTFSRGGMFAFLGAVGGSCVVMFFLDKKFRRNLLSKVPLLFFVTILLGVISIFANQLTDGWLLHRYMNKRTYDIMNNSNRGKAVLTGREEIAEAELELFSENPVLGVGVGMSKTLRREMYGENAGYLSMASHTEYTRILAEHGSLGVLFLFLAFFLLPLRRYCFDKSSLSREFMLLFFFCGALTLFHAAMRLSLAGVLIGMSFIKITSIDLRRKGNE